MDTLEFFRAILPAVGPYYLAYMDGDKPYPYHVLFPTLETLAQKAKVFDDQGKTVYHACASYKEASVSLPDPKRPGEMRKYYRVAENMGRIKSFWVDIDCGEDKADAGKGYATKKEGAGALYEFCQRVGLVAPMLVSSGNGLHAYWPLTKDISPNAWRAVATGLKAALAEHKVLADPTRTADASSILRPVGTTNRKGEGKGVKVLHPGAGATTPEAFLAAIKAVSTLAPVVEEVPAYLRAAGTTNALAEAVKRDHPPASAVAVAEKCAQLAAMRDTQGCVEYPIWFKCLGLIKHCTEGLDLAQEWSSGHQTYDPQATEAKFDDWNTGPATCASFQADNPKGCEGCQYRKDDGGFALTSPIQLGTVAPETSAETVEALAEDETPITVDIPSPPDGYGWDGRRLWRLVENEDGVPTLRTLTSDRFWVYGWASEDKDFSVMCRLIKPKGDLLEWDFKSSLLASQSDLMKELSLRSVHIPSEPKDTARHLSAYVSDSFAAIKKQVTEMETWRNFGWDKRRTAFLLGDRVFETSGVERKVRLSSSAAELAEEAFFEPRGTLDAYVGAMNSVYGMRGMEPMQFAYANAFGSLLTPFSGELLYAGIMFAITGPRTARGKTTVCNAALAGFGDARRMTHTKSSTVAARPGFMGTHNNLPILFDEFTDIDPAELSAWAYDVSSGIEKSRMLATATGVGLAKPRTWMMAPYITANTDLHARLAQHKDNSAAEAVRIVQVRIDKYALPVHPAGFVAAALTTMQQNCGHAGEAFVRYVTTNLEKVITDVALMRSMLESRVLGEPYRNYRAHAAVTLVAAQILVDLGIAYFDMNRLVPFVVNMLHEMQLEVQTQNMASDEDLLARMVNSLAPRIISTWGYATGTRSAPEEVRITQEIAGRRIIGNPSNPGTYDGRLYMSKRAVMDWCTDRRADFSALLDGARQAGVLVSDHEAFNLARGTTAPGTKTTCVVFDLAKLDADAMLPPLQAVAEAV